MDHYGHRTDYIRSLKPEPGKEWDRSVLEGYLDGLHEPVYFPGVGERDPSTNQCRFQDMDGPYDITLVDTPQHIIFRLRSADSPTPHDLRLNKAAWFPELGKRQDLIARYVEAARTGDAATNKEANRARREHHDAMAATLHERLGEQGLDIHVHTCVTLVGFLTQLYAPELGRPPGASPSR